MQTNFEKLDIYKLSEQLSDEIWKIVIDWDHLARNTVGAQVVRSTDSIGANIAEGSGRGSDKDFLRFLRMARGSLYETKHWLRRAYRRNLLSVEASARLKPLMDELVPKLNVYIRSVGKMKLIAKTAKDQKPKSQDQIN